LEGRGLIGDVQVSRPATNLRKLLPKISSQRTRDFVDEAVTCYEKKSYRACIVLSWVGAVALLYDHVFNNKLQPFNVELTRRFPQQKPVHSIDDFADIKEFTFLDILQDISVVGQSVKEELKARLKLRNGSGHPNGLQVGQLVAAAHLESLINHVYAVF
jgi:hypothetical protein